MLLLKFKSNSRHWLFFSAFVFIQLCIWTFTNIQRIKTPLLWRWWSLTPTLTVGSCCVLLGRGCRYCRWNEIAAFRFFTVQKECFKNTREQPVRKWWLLMYEEWVSDAFWHFSASSLLLGLTGHRNRRRKTSNYSTWSWRNFFIISRNIYKTTYWYLTVWQGNKITTAVISTISHSFSVIFSFDTLSLHSL